VTETTTPAATPTGSMLLREAADTLRVVYAPVLLGMEDDPYRAVDIAEPLAAFLDRCADAIAFCEAEGLAGTPIVDELRTLAEKVVSVDDHQGGGVR
jgi:hypothetical protein